MLLRALALMLCVWVANASAADSALALKAGVFDPPRAAPDFTLQRSNGQPLTLRDFRGKIVILGFGFTSCPDVCPTTLGVLAQAHKKLGAQGEDVQVVYITVDPERDTPERMHAYLKSFDPSFIGGTGSAEQLAAVRKEYGIQANRKQFGQNYTFGHSSFIYLIDRKGLLRALMPYGHSPDDYVHDAKLLLAQ
ncbi:MAG TPA: SCO family protein [Steroidobacteraceae bacterium]|nr:SCO family protein [Steroidobacteraceae bacterium]